MESAQKRQKSGWFSGLTNFVAGGRASTTDSPSIRPTTNGGEHARPRPVPSDDRTPSRPRNTFTAPSPDEADSPPKRASPSLLAQRKILERPQPSSTRFSASISRATNFSSSTAPPRIFGASIARDRAGFSFTPPVPANAYKATFPPETPGRLYKSSAAELSGRGMSKTTSSDLFTMRIPEPDPKLTGEAIAKQVPEDPSRTGSVYASEFLAHLCPAEFNETQRNQFFCILDLRRLKYAANEIFQKKDWKLNILNFAKEYEKSRSLIMLRYGLFEFKSVKVSKDVLHKWKLANNIPDDDDDDGGSMVAATPAPKIRVNGTEGILGKRKQEEDHPQPKRARVAERPPLAETTTPALNSGGNKRKATVAPDDVDETPPTKSAKATLGTSATKAFFEKVANTPAKGKEATSGVTPRVPAHKTSADDSSKTPKARPNVFAPAPKLTDGSLVRSVLDGGLKPSPSQSNNIFGYLSDASSAKGSGNENADADGEDSDESGDVSENHDVSQSEPSVVASGGIATPQPDGPLFQRAKPAAIISGSGTSSDVSEAGSGKSLKDRVSKDAHGEPVRAVQEKAAPTFGSQPSTQRPASPVKTAAPVNQTWNPETPIKFGAQPPPAVSVFGASSTKPTPSLFASSTSAAASTTPAGFGFGSAPAAQPAEAPSPPKGTGADPTPEPAGLGSGRTAAPQPAFGSAPSQAQPSLFASSASAFGKAARVEPRAEVPAPAAAVPSLFAAQAQTPAAPVLQSQTLFGTAGKPDTTKTVEPVSKGLFGTTSTLSQPSSGSLFPGTSKTSSTGFNIFGGAPASTPAAAGEQTQTKSPFGAASGQPSSNLFGTGGAKANGALGATDAAAASSAKSLFGISSAPVAGQDSKPLFGNAPPSGTETPKPASNLFGATPAPASASYTFGSTPVPTSAPSIAPTISFGTTFGTQPGASQPTGQVVFGGGDSGSAGSSFTFTAGGNNPFSSEGAGAPSLPTMNFGGGGGGAAPATTSFTFGAGSGATTPAAGATPTPSFSFGGAQPSGNTGPSPGLFGGGPSAPTSGAGSLFNFGGATQPADGSTAFPQQKPAPFGINLAPHPSGTSTGTSKSQTPFEFRWQPQP